MTNDALKLGAVKFLQKTSGGANYRVFGIAAGSKSIGGGVVNNIEFGLGNLGGQAKIFNRSVEEEIFLAIGETGARDGGDDFVRIPIAKKTH